MESATRFPHHGDDMYKTQNVCLVEFYRFCLKHVLDLMNIVRHFKINLAPNYTYNFTHILLFPAFIPTIIKKQHTWVNNVTSVYIPQYSVKKKTECTVKQTPLY